MIRKSVINPPCATAKTILLVNYIDHNKDVPFPLTVPSTLLRSILRRHCTKYRFSPAGEKLQNCPVNLGIKIAVQVAGDAYVNQAAVRLKTN
ncbi:MAG: hypothetical protein ACYCYO_15960, partial [Bacilli bacterium]